MKTIYTIGRAAESDIYLPDNSNILSRNHAVLKIGKDGKYYLTDHSMNGTYINGIRIAHGAEVPVKRSDTVTFAHIAELDWYLIPSLHRKQGVILMGLAAGLAVVMAIAVGVSRLIENMKPLLTNPEENAIAAPADTTGQDDTL